MIIGPGTYVLCMRPGISLGKQVSGALATTKVI